jgi:hypothetical protein
MFDPLLGSALIFYGGIVGGLYAFQRRLLYHPRSTRPALDDLATLGVREVELTTRDGLRLFSWYLPPRAGRPVVAYFHGNGGHIGYRAERLRRFAREGYGVCSLNIAAMAATPARRAKAGCLPMARRRSISSLATRLDRPKLCFGASRWVRGWPFILPPRIILRP